MRLGRWIAIFGLVALVGVPGFAESGQLEANKELVRRFAAVLNSAEWDGLDELLADDFTRHCQATPDIQVRSREQFKQLQQGFLHSVPDQRVDLGMLVAEGDKVAVSAVYSGTQTGAMGAIPPTGKHFESHFLSIAPGGSKAYNLNPTSEELPGA